MRIYGEKAKEEVFSKFKCNSIVENELIPIYEGITKLRES